MTVSMHLIIHMLVVCSLVNYLWLLGVVSLDSVIPTFPLRVFMVFMFIKFSCVM